MADQLVKIVFSTSCQALGNTLDEVSKNAFGESVDRLSIINIFYIGITTQIIQKNSFFQYMDLSTV